MSESRTHGSGTGPSEGRGEHERDKEEFQAGTGYQPSTNQARDEPLPASHHDDGRQEPARRRGEPGRDDAADHGQTGRSQTGGTDSARGQASDGEEGQGS
jgi:hypothetical protein